MQHYKITFQHVETTIFESHVYLDASSEDEAFKLAEKEAENGLEDWENIHSECSREAITGIRIFNNEKL